MHDLYKPEWLVALHELGKLECAEGRYADAAPSFQGALSFGHSSAIARPCSAIYISAISRYISAVLPRRAPHRASGAADAAAAAVRMVRVAHAAGNRELYCYAYARRPICIRITLRPLGNT